MKKILTFLALILGFSTMAQINVTVSGHVVHQTTGNPVANQLVVVVLTPIGGDSLSGVATAVPTDTSGYYEVTSFLEGQQGLLVVSTDACNGTQLSETTTVGINQPNSFIFNFAVLCQNAACQAMYSYFPAGPLTVQFQNESYGDGLSYQWDFSDGTASSDTNPLKSWDNPGVYEVKLIATSADGSCFSSYSNLVFVGDSLPQDCFAMFYYVPSANSPSTMAFTDISTGFPTSWVWDFGDGITTAEQHPVHDFPGAGVYNVNLTIHNDATQCSSSITLPVFVGDTINPGCQAKFGYFPGPQPLTVNFMNESFGNFDMQSWDFGDGNTSSEHSPMHQYAAAGEYTVSLNIYSADGSCESSYTETVFVGAAPPCQAFFEPLPTPGQTAIFFQNLSQGIFTQQHWDFGDNTTSTEFSPTHEYTVPGIYNVCLTISAPDSNCYDVFCQTVVSGGNSNCLAKFSYFPDSLNGQQAMHFLDMSVGQITAWSWDFGDGSSSTEQNPVHFYAENGSYQVCLTVSGTDPSGASCQSSWCEQVYVGGGTGNCFNYFTYSVVGNDVLFEGFHSTDVPASYQWDFGTGVVTLGNPITYSFPGPGVYYVTLVSWDDNNCMAASSQNVVIGDSVAFNQVYGQVFEGAFPTTAGMTLIFSMQADTNYLPFVAVAPLQEAGVYMFPFVPSGSFNILALPSGSNGYLPTYYGNTLFWEEALPVIPGVTPNPCDIQLIQASGTPDAGSGSISGVINPGQTGQAYLDKINVFLLNDAHSIISYQAVNQDGSFSFSNLAFGNYYLYPELAGVNSEYMPVELGEAQPEIVFNMTFTGNGFLGVAENKGNISVGAMYPNPADDKLQLTYQSQYPGLIHWTVTDLSGRIAGEGSTKAGSGTNSLSLPVATLPSGLYLLRLTHENGDQHHSKFIKR